MTLDEETAFAWWCFQLVARRFVVRDGGSAAGLVTRTIRGPSLPSTLLGPAELLSISASAAADSVAAATAAFVAGEGDFPAPATLCLAFAFCPGKISSGSEAAWRKTPMPLVLLPGKRSLRSTATKEPVVEPRCVIPATGKRDVVWGCRLATVVDVMPLCSSEPKPARIRSPTADGRGGAGRTGPKSDKLR